MANSINWTGNKVFEPSGARQAAKPAAAAVPTVPSVPSIPTVPTVPNDMDTMPGPPPVTDRGYIPNYLARNKGKFVNAEFIVGSNQFVDKSGVIKEVGINYFVLYDPNSRTDTMCDLYSVKFVSMVTDQNV